MWGLTTMKTIWSYTTCEILPSKINNKTEFLLPTKPVPQIWIMSVRWVSLLFWKYLLVKEEQWFCWKKVSKFLRAALIANERQIDVGKISGKKLGNFVTPTTKTDILIFLKQEKLLAGTIHIKYLISLKAMYGENMKEIDFRLLPQNQEFPHYEYIIGGFPLSPGKIYILVKV